jgi:hypothetical protein
MPAFDRYVGINYSGAETPAAPLTGLRIYMGEPDSPPVEIVPPPGPGKYWTRRGIAEWLAQRLAEDEATLVGIRHGFSFPLRYFEAHGLALDWPAFLDDFQRHWPTDDDHTYVDFVREGVMGNGADRAGDTSWRRLTEMRAGVARSLFHFQAPGSVGKATHAGLPWLRYLRQRAGHRVHVWPFDGWDVPAGRSVVAEVHPSPWSRSFAREGRTARQHDAFAIAAWLRDVDGDGALVRCLDPTLEPGERATARIEGWILGVGAAGEALDA